MAVSGSARPMALSRITAASSGPTARAAGDTIVAIVDIHTLLTLILDTPIHRQRCKSTPEVDAAAEARWR